MRLARSKAAQRADEKDAPTAARWDKQMAGNSAKRRVELMEYSSVWRSAAQKMSRWAGGSVLLWAVMWEEMKAAQMVAGSELN